MGRVKSGDDFIIHGNTYNHSNWNNEAWTGDMTYHGLVTNTGSFYLSTGENNMNGGIRNVGGSIN